METLNQHIAARNDIDLRDRLVAAAEQLGIESAAAWVDQHMGVLVSQDVAQGQTIADVHAYAVASYTPTPRPGQDPTKVTDAYLTNAVTKVHGS